MASPAQMSVFDLPTPEALTATNAVHGVVTFAMLHWVKGSADFYDQVWCGQGRGPQRAPCRPQRAPTRACFSVGLLQRELPEALQRHRPELRVRGNPKLEK